MPITTDIDHAKELFLIRTPGGCRCEELEAVLRAFYADEPTRRILADFSGEGNVWTTDEVRQLVVFLASIRDSIPDHSRVAAVCSRVADYGLARMAQTLSEMKIPWTMAVFWNREEALDWLLQEA